MKKYYWMILFLIFCCLNERLLRGIGSESENEDDVLTNDFFSNLSELEKLLYEAIIKDNVDLVEKLLKTKPEKVSVKSIIGPAGARPLMIATSAKMVDLLVSMGAEVDDQDNEGRAPLHWAARFGYFGMAKKLIQYKANMWLKDIHGSIPISFVNQDEQEMTFDDYRICEMLTEKQVSEKTIFSEDLEKYHTHLFWRCSKTGDTYLHRFIGNLFEKDLTSEGKRENLQRELEKIKKIKKSECINNKQLLWLFTRNNKIEGNIFQFVLYKEKPDLALMLFDFFITHIQCSREDLIRFFNKKSPKIAKLWGKKTVYDCLRLCDNSKYDELQKKDYDILCKKLNFFTYENSKIRRKKKE